VKVWQNIPFGHIIFPGPQRHVAFVCCSISQGGAFGDALAPFASAEPTDMAVASNATAKVFNMISSSLVESGTCGADWNNTRPRTSDSN
jgi:hypothetical protein